MAIDESIIEGIANNTIRTLTLPALDKDDLSRLEAALANNFSIMQINLGEQIPDPNIHKLLTIIKKSNGNKGNPNLIRTNRFSELDAYCSNNIADAKYLLLKAHQKPQNLLPGDIEAIQDRFPAIAVTMYEHNPDGETNTGCEKLLKSIMANVAERARDLDIKFEPLAMPDDNPETGKTRMGQTMTQLCSVTPVPMLRKPIGIKGNDHPRGA